MTMVPRTSEARAIEGYHPSHFNGRDAQRQPSRNEESDSARHQAHERQTRNFEHKTHEIDEQTSSKEAIRQDEQTRLSKEGVSAATAALTQHSSRSAMKTQQLAVEYTQSLEKRIKYLDNLNKTLESEKANLDLEIKAHIRDNSNCKRMIKPTRNELDHVKTLYSHIVTNYFLPYASHQNLVYYDRSPTSLDTVLGPLLKDALEATPLRAEVEVLRLEIQILQKEMLANVERVQSVSDEQFSQDFGKLASAIKSLSRAIKLPTAVDVAGIELLHDCIMVKAVPATYWSTGARKKCMVEAVIWSVLWQCLFRTPFNMFGPHCIDVQDTCDKLFGTEHDHDWPVPSELAERWRCTTMGHMVGLIGAENIINGPPEGNTTGVAKSMRRVRDVIYGSITSTFAPLSPTTDFSKLRTIIDKAFALALQMFLQRSRYQIVWPALGSIFQVGETHHLSSIEESEDVEQGCVKFIVNAGLTKWGDAHGKHLDTRLDLVASHVFVEAFDMIA